MTWTPLHLHSHFSILDGLSTPERIAERCQELGYTTCALTDHRTISGVPSLFNVFKKSKLKPIAGCEFDISSQSASVRSAENRSTEHLVVLAKNLQGWKDLIRATNASNHPTNFYYKARLSLEELASYCTGNWILFSGHMGSHLSNILFEEPKLAYRVYSENEARKLMRPDAIERASALASKFCQLFGKNNFLVEIQLIDRDNLPAMQIIADTLRKVADLMALPRLATADSHYAAREDAVDQRIVVASALKAKLPKIQESLARGEDVQLGAFFRSNNYHIPSLEDLKGLHTQEEIDNANKIAELCEEYSLNNKPYMPKFPIPQEGDGTSETSVVSSMEYLKEVCRAGWAKRIIPEISPEKRSEYVERIRMELGVIEEADILADYFLIVYDYANWARSKGYLVGERGSGAGCLVSYLTDITTLDPVKYDLIFERFYTASRNTPAHVSFEELSFDDWEGLASASPSPSASLISPEEFLGLSLPDRRHALETDHGRREISLLRGRVLRYYKHLYDNVELDRANPQNSIVLWALGKVDGLDVTKSPKIKEAKASLPDIDLDFPVDARDKVIEYIVSKFGSDKVALMATFGRLQGRGALKEVLGVHGKTSFEEMNRITDPIPDASAISDDLQEMEELTGDSSIILWALQHRSKDLKEWCYLGEPDGPESGPPELKGPLAHIFAQAMRLEGTIKSRGTHASGVVISSEPIADICPMVFDAGSKRLLVAVDMRDAEDLGLVKFDILGSLSLDELAITTNIIRTGVI